MNTSLRALRYFVKSVVLEALSGSDPSEAYDKELLDDPSLRGVSVYVPRKTKREIGKWASDMGLSKKKRRRRS